MSRFRQLVFVCQNDRSADDARGCCHSKGSAALLARLKELTHASGLKGKVRVTGSGCLDFCAKGITAVVFAGGNERWLTGLTPQDADAVFAEHIKGPPKADAARES
jgi:(2Fe-2S) ferredoxin